MKVNRVHPAASGGCRLRPALAAVFATVVFCFDVHSQESPDQVGNESEALKKRLEELEVFYQEKLTEVQAPVIERYLTSLAALKAKYTSAGNLNEAAKVGLEIEWVKSGGWIRKPSKDLTEPGNSPAPPPADVTP